MLHLESVEDKKRLQIYHWEVSELKVTVTADIVEKSELIIVSLSTARVASINSCETKTVHLEETFLISSNTLAGYQVKTNHSISHLITRQDHQKKLDVSKLTLGQDYPTGNTFQESSR